jgi:hypothetical protein
MLPAITPMLLLDPEEEDEVLAGVVVAEGTAPGPFEGDAWLLCDDAVEMEDALGVTADDDSAVVVAVCHQLNAHRNKQLPKYPHKALCSSHCACPSNRSRCA